MKKKIYAVAIFCAMLMLLCGQKSFAKYVIQDSLSMQLYIDKTPPQIDLVCDERTENFASSNLGDTQKRSNDVKINTSDNIAVAKNEYYFNATNLDFEGLTSTEFAVGQVISEEGYYKIVVTDTSKNKTEIVVLLDKSAPEVIVQYFKKGEASILREVAAKSSNWVSSDVVNTTDQEVEDTLEAGNVVQEGENTVTNELGKQENVAENQVDIAENIVAQNIVENQVCEEQKNQTEEGQAQESATKETDESGEKLLEVAEETVQDVEQLDEESSVEVAEVLEFNILEENQVMLMAASDVYVGNEVEFRNALSSQAAVIHVRQSIDFTSPVYIDYPVNVVSEGTSNSLRYGNVGSFIVVQNGGSLFLDSMVIDTYSSGVYGITAIDIQSGGETTFVNSSILDGGLGNTGILINAGGTLVLWSSEFVRCGYGINLQATGQLFFGTQEGRCNNFYSNTTGVFIDNFSGNCDFNQNISMHDNTNGILSANIYGTVNVTAGDYYNNYNGINCGGTVNVYGGSFYGNTNGLYANNSYSGSLILASADIHSNKSYAVYHEKTADEGCIILGGSIIGEVFLAQNDNYVNTNSSYPVFTVTPSTYYFKRKLVKTDSNGIAQNEISNVTLTPKDSWYRYVDNEYIVLWQGCNVIVQYKDYYGKILSSEVITGNLGAQYTTSAKAISGYDLVQVPSNAVGVFTQQDITVVYKYDLVNCARVSFEDLLSGVVSAKYWYNASEENFTGNGIEFANNIVFEDYGYYKIVAQNGVGLTKEITFLLNENSLKR